MYKSIIFDIGGVLVDFDPKAYLVDRLCNAEMEEKVYDLTFGSEEWQLLDAGKLSRYDGNQRMLEHARAEKLIGASLEASVTLYCNDAVYDLLNSIPMDELADLMIVSHVELVKGEGGAASAVEGLGVAAAHATGEKCERCWKYSSSIGSHAAHPTLCARCASVVEA